jgi:hypothetical protein
MENQYHLSSDKKGYGMPRREYVGLVPRSTPNISIIMGLAALPKTHIYITHCLLR